ncbi:MAG: DNA (cytosine-5-)-methyltransferase, partial [Anaerovoracaceae bacterium]
MEKTMVELFAGVGGFRIGLEKLNSNWETKWFSQWEPDKNKQWAHDCYVYHFGDNKNLDGDYTTGNDISTVDKNGIPNHTLLTGGFPCQDYSVAHSLSSARGIEGKKGVLWWQIRDILIAKRPPFVILENVDRLLKSPASQRGRDFGIILTSFAQLGYRVEWRVVNAAEYGAAQRRRRTFIFAYSKDTEYAKSVDPKDAENLILKYGFMAKAFPIKDNKEMFYGKVDYTDISKVDIHTMLDVGTVESDNDLLNMTDTFSFGFMNSGYMIDGKFVTTNTIPEQIDPSLLSEVVEQKVDESYYIKQEDMSSWAYMKGGKKIPRTSKTGH